MNFGKLEDWCLVRYYDDTRALRKARLLVRACLLTSLFSISYVALSAVFSYEKGMYFTGFNVVGYFVLPLLLRTKLPLSLLGNLYTAIGAITVLVLTWFSGGMWSAIYPWIIAIPTLALLIDGKTPSLEAFIGSEGAILKVSWRTPRPDNLRTIQKYQRIH